MGPIQHSQPLEHVHADRLQTIIDRPLPDDPLASGLTAITDINIHTAVDDWLIDSDSASITYGDMTWWDTQVWVA